MPQYGEPQYGAPSNNVPFFLTLLVDSQPPAYREFRDFLERLLLPSAEDLAAVNDTIDLLDTYVLPESAPEEWINWMLAEWFGWHLIPEGYPLARRRRLLANLHLHYKRRYTLVGIRDLLKEFGIIAQVYDKPLFVGGYYGSFGSRWPLNVRVRILGYEPFESPQRTYVAGYYGGAYAYRTKQILTEKFVMNLVRWERSAGVQFLVEWVSARQSVFNEAFIPDDDEIVP